MHRKIKLDARLKETDIIKSKNFIILYYNHNIKCQPAWSIFFLHFNVKLGVNRAF